MLCRFRPILVHCTASIAVAVLGASTLRAQERTPVVRPGAPLPVGAPPLRLPETLTPHTLHRGVEGEAPEVESSFPDELTRSPDLGAEGDLFSQQPLPEHLLGDPYRLSYVGGDYVPGPDERVDPELVRALTRRGAVGETYGFVMFQGRITTAKRRAVEALGVTLGNHHTFNCMTAVIPFETVPLLARSDLVRWVGYARPQQKIEPGLRARIATNADPNELARLFVKVYRSDLTAAAQRIPIGEAGGDEQARVLQAFRTLPNGPFQRELESRGATVVDYHDHLELFAVEAPLASVASFADCDFVHYVELDGRIEPAHDRSTRQIGIDYVRSIATNDGRDTVVGMMDSGMDLTHDDVRTHWYAAWGYDGQSPYIDSTGHGTHVMGTISGTGAANSRYTGCAPRVGSQNDRRIYVAAIFDGPSSNATSNNAINAFTRLATPITISGITTPIPSVVNHSWGVGTSNMPANGWTGTDSLSIALDDRVFNDRQTHVVAAHNQGGSSYASQNYNNVLRPAVAKSALTVASCLDATENASYPGRVYFESNKGPTGDGRLVPHVTAPGRWIRSVQAGTTNQYVSFQGTSMASPHVSGTIAGMHTHDTWMKQSPAATRAVVAATTNPYLATRSWTQTSESYYNRQGMGQIDAYKAHYQRDEPGGFLAGRYYGTLTSSSAGFSFDVDVPADADRTFFVLAFDEKAASQGAARACIHDLDLHLDVEPFTAGYDTGEFHATRAWDTWDWYGNIGTISQVQGRRVRVKVHPRVRPSGRDVVHFGVAYMIPRGDTTPDGAIAAIASATEVRPNQTFQMTAQLDIPEYMQTNSLVTILPPTGFSVSELSFVDRGGLPRLYTGGSTPLEWTLGIQGYWFAANHRRLTWEVRAPSTEGQWPLCVRLRADNHAIVPFDCEQICVDGSAPFLIVNLASPTHPTGTWVASGNFQITWQQASDNGCAGLAGLAHTLAVGAPTTPSTTPTLAGNTTQFVAALGSSAQDQFFAIRAIDRAGNANNRSIYGPVRVDTVDPIVQSVDIEQGATHTTTLLVDVTVAASDAHSGVHEMRHSMDGRTWSRWTTYSAGPNPVDLSQFGGSTAEGTKVVWWQVRDQAGNESVARRDTIDYQRCPQLRQVVGSSTLENVTDAHFVLSGSDLADITEVHFGSRVLQGGTPPNWDAGRFEVIDDNSIRVFPPQALPPGAFSVSVRSRLCASNRLSVNLVANASPTLGAPVSVPAGTAFRTFVAAGGTSPQTLIGLAASPFNQPTTVPGVISLGIGQQFAWLLIFPDAKLADPANRAAAWTVPTVGSMQGTSLFFQAFLVDLGMPSPLPALTTAVRAVAFD